MTIRHSFSFNAKTIQACATSGIPMLEGMRRFWYRAPPGSLCRFPKGKRFFLANPGYGAFPIWLSTHRTRTMMTTAKQLMHRRHKLLASSVARPFGFNPTKLQTASVVVLWPSLRS
jgi:hypothetical protein